MEGFTRVFTKEIRFGLLNPQRVPKFLNPWEVEAGKSLACPGRALRCLSGGTKSRAEFVTRQNTGSEECN